MTQALPDPTSRRSLPRWIVLAYTAWMLVWVPAYWHQYGLIHFLWFCDTANFLLLVAVWRSSALLFSGLSVAVLVIQVAWMVDYFGALALGFHPIGGTEYMFETSIPWLLRAFSLFHLWVPVLLLWGLRHLGYDRRGPWVATALAWVLVPASYLAHPLDPDLNLNWIERPFGYEQVWLPDWLYVPFVMVVLPTVLYWPSHLLLTKLFPSAPGAIPSAEASVDAPPFSARIRGGLGRRRARARAIPPPRPDARASTNGRPGAGPPPWTRAAGGGG